VEGEGEPARESRLFLSGFENRCTGITNWRPNLDAASACRLLLVSVSNLEGSAGVLSLSRFRDFVSPISIRAR
jgi:hypothetical protein